MGKNKLEKFADMASYPHVFEYPYSAVDNVPFGMKGKWHKEFFKNDHPIVLELGCGRGEYTVGLGKMFPEKNFIAVDIKGARMWTGATESLQVVFSNGVIGNWQEPYGCRFIVCNATCGPRPVPGE